MKLLLCTYMLLRDEERRKKEVSKVKQTTKQSNTTHPRQYIYNCWGKLYGLIETNYCVREKMKLRDSCDGAS